MKERRKRKFLTWGESEERYKKLQEDEEKLKEDEEEINEEALGSQKGEDEEVKEDKDEVRG